MSLEYLIPIPVFGYCKIRYPRLIQHDQISHALSPFLGVHHPAADWEMTSGRYVGPRPENDKPTRGHFESLSGVCEYSHGLHGIWSSMIFLSVAKSVEWGKRPSVMLAVTTSDLIFRDQFHFNNRGMTFQVWPSSWNRQTACGCKLSAPRISQGFPTSKIRVLPRKPYGMENVRTLFTVEQIAPSSTIARNRDVGLLSNNGLYFSGITIQDGGVDFDGAWLERRATSRNSSKSGNRSRAHLESQPR